MFWEKIKNKKNYSNVPTQQYLGVIQITYNQTVFNYEYHVYNPKNVRTTFISLTSIMKKKNDKVSSINIRH